MKKVLIYTKQLCPSCIKAKAFLKQNGVSEIEEVDIEKDSEKQEEAFTRSGGKKTVPQIFAGDVYIGGCDDLLAIPRDKLVSILS